MTNRLCRIHPCTEQPCWRCAQEIDTSQIQTNSVRVQCDKEGCSFGCDVPVREAIVVAQRHRADRTKHGDFGHHVSFSKGDKKVDYDVARRARLSSNYDMSPTTILRKIKEWQNEPR